MHFIRIGGLLIVLICGLTAPGTAQQFTLSIHTVYAQYRMTEMKNLLQEKYQEMRESVDVPYSITNDFPGYFGYDALFSIRLSKWMIGQKINLLSTGGRIIYRDNTGYKRYDIDLEAAEFTDYVSYTVENTGKIDFEVFLNAGICFSYAGVEPRSHLTNGSDYYENATYSSINGTLGPGIKGRYHVGSKLFLEAVASYDIQIAGRLYDNDYYSNFLVDSKNSGVEADWTGVRMGLGVGIIFNKVSDEN